jgi:hypothetical protein
MAQRREKTSTDSIFWVRAAAAPIRGTVSALNPIILTDILFGDCEQLTIYIPFSRMCAFQCRAELPDIAHRPPLDNQ